MLNHDFREFVALLNSHDVRYLVVGGYAVAFHGQTTLSGVDFDEAYARRRAIDVDGVSVAFIGLDDLRNNKRTVGRHQDLADLEQWATSADRSARITHRTVT